MEGASEYRSGRSPEVKRNWTEFSPELEPEDLTRKVAEHLHRLICKEGGRYCTFHIENWESIRYERNKYLTMARGLIIACDRDIDRINKVLKALTPWAL